MKEGHNTAPVVFLLTAAASVATTGSYTMEFGNDGIYGSGPSESFTWAGQHATVEVWLHLPPYTPMMSANVDLAVGYSPGPGGFVWDAVSPGPYMDWLVPPPHLPAELNGWISALYCALEPDYYILGPADVLLFTLLLHDTGFPSQTVLGFDTAPGEVNEYYAGYTAPIQPALGPPVVAHWGLPEPGALIFAVGGVGILAWRRPSNRRGSVGGVPARTLHMRRSGQDT